MALHLIGLGLYDASDVTVKGLERIRACDEVVAEFYTAKLTGTPFDELEAFLERKVRVLDREGVELGGKDLVARAKTSDIALLTAGDPLSATTHADLIVRCRAEGVPVRVVHAPSIFSAAPGLVGLQHYKFGRTTTLVRPEDNWMPTSPFDAVQENHELGNHTLVLLDIKADESYYMPANEGIGLLLKLAEMTGNDWFNEETQVAVIARAGADEPHVVTGPAGALQGMDHGEPLHCIVVPGGLQVVEQEFWDSLQC
ncbi:MAG: diphthine synthase [Thermoplasmatota archaeon]